MCERTDLFYRFFTLKDIYSLALAKQQLTEDDTLLLESDLIIDDSILQLLVSTPEPNLALVAKYESWMDGTMVRMDSERNIVKAFYGIGQQEMTLEEIGTKFGLTRERVRQIKEKAIRRLRNNTKNKILKAYLGQ